MLDWHIDHNAAARRINFSHGHDIRQFGRHQQVSFIGGQHSEHVRGFAGLIRFFVGNELDRFLVIVSIFKIGPFAFLVGRPERAATIHDLLTVFVEDGFDVNAAGRGHREIVSGIALAVCVHIGRA